MTNFHRTSLVLKLEILLWKNKPKQLSSVWKLNYIPAALWYFTELTNGWLGSETLESVEHNACLAITGVMRVFFKEKSTSGRLCAGSRNLENRIFMVILESLEISWIVWKFNKNGLKSPEKSGKIFQIILLETFGAKFWAVHLLKSFSLLFLLSIKYTC